MSTENVSRPPLIVVGMHRSGTSFVASLLHAAGVDMGSRLMPPARGNERGHFENMDFVEFHMRELRLTGHDDAGWAALATLKLPEDAASEAHEIIKTSARSAAWGWKDPRTTLFLDFWASIVPDANYLYIYREPTEVIDSLYRRGDESIQLSPELAARAYLIHNEMMLRDAREHRERSIIANVSAIARDPEQFLMAVAEKFDVALNAHAPSPFEGELMRTIASDEPRAALLRYLVPEVEALYANLESEADIPSGIGETKPVSPRKLKDAFFVDWLRERKLDNELHQRDAALEQRDAELQAIREALSNVDASNTLRGAHLEEAERLLTAEREAHETNVKKLRIEVEETENSLYTAGSQNEALRSAIADLEVQLENARTQNRDLEAPLKEAIQNLETLLENARNGNQDLKQCLEQTDRELTAQIEAQIAATRAESERVAFLIATVQSSRFWKIKRGINRMRSMFHFDRR